MNDNDLLLLDTSEITMEDITILQEAINEINKNRIKIKSKWIDSHSIPVLFVFILISALAVGSAWVLYLFYI